MRGVIHKVKVLLHNVGGVLHKVKVFAHKVRGAEHKVKGVVQKVKALIQKVKGCVLQGLIHKLKHICKTHKGFPPAMFAKELSLLPSHKAKS